MPFSMNVESVSAASNEMNLPCSIAAAESLVSPIGKARVRMLDQKTKEHIIAEETSRWMGGDFRQLDLSESPDLNNRPPEDELELRDRLGFNCVDDTGLSGINQLRELLANPPREVVEEIAQETEILQLMSELAHFSFGTKPVSL